MAKVNVYIDGFNLYYGALKGTPYKWLNLAHLCQTLLPTDTVQEIKYFTARVSARPRKPTRLAEVGGSPSHSALSSGPLPTAYLLPSAPMPPRNAIRAVLLDWDGTLLDSYHADTCSYIEMFRALGISWGVRELAAHYSPDWYKVYRAAGLPRKQWDEADRLWRLAYRRHQPKLMAGARAVLSELRSHYRLGLVTSGDCGRVLPQLRHFRLTRAFSARICQQDSRHRKPHPGPLLLALRQLKIPAAHSVFVGDAPEDIEMAQRAGVRSIGVLGPFPTAKRLRAARPDALLDSLEKLPRFLIEWSAASSAQNGELRV